MQCSICGYKADCNCVFKDGMCKTCQLTTKSNPVSNSCNQTLENLNRIRAILINLPKDRLREYQISIINSQIAQFNKNPCRFKTFIDNILVN